MFILQRKSNRKRSHVNLRQSKQTLDIVDVVRSDAEGMRKQRRPGRRLVKSVRVGLLFCESVVYGTLNIR